MDKPVRIDARGLKCPLPVLKTEKVLNGMAGAVSIDILADDPVARVDIPLLARKRGLDCAIETLDGYLLFRLTDVS